MTFVVFGSPKPAGSKRGFRIPGTEKISITDANPKSRSWKNRVAQVAGNRMLLDGRDGLFRGPLSVVFRFFVARPKGHFNKSGLSAAGRRMPWPAKRPDVLKLARGVEDALSKVVYGDDSQIVAERLIKEWGEPERVEIMVQEMKPGVLTDLPESGNFALDF